MSFWRWSRVAATNGTADPSINFAEGMAPSGLNDSGRAVMAAAAKYRDDVGGSLITGGTSTAYTVSSNQVFGALADMDYKEISFFVHATNGASPTLNVDALGAKAIVMDGFGTAVPAGTLIQGTPYTAVYVNATTNWRLKDFYQIPYMVPVGGSIEFWGTTSPNSSFVIPAGQAISRTTYSTLFGLIGTTYGSGDGSTTFTLPNPAGRAVVQKESSASLLTASYFGGNSTSLGATGGGESATLTLAQLPTGITSTGTFSVVGITNNTLSFMTASAQLIGFSGNAGAQVWQAPSQATTTLTQSATASGATTSNNTGGAGHRTVQPTIIANRIMRVI